MKKLFTTLLILVCLGAIGYGVYYYWDKQKAVDTWALVPENAILVYENNNLISSWNDLQENPIWQDLMNIPDFKKMKTGFESLDSLSGNNGSLDKLLKNNRVLISAHVTAKDAFDFVFYNAIKTPEQKEIVGNLVKSFKKLTIKERTYNGFSINELKDENGETAFTYIIYKSNFVGSFTPFLVEDVIRNIQKGEKDFKQNNEPLFKVAKLQNDAGNLFVDFGKLEDIFKVFTQNTNSDFLNLISNFSGPTFLDFQMEEKSIFLNGFSFQRSDNSFLSSYKGQTGGPVTLDEYLPARTALLLHERFSDPEQWNANLISYWNEHNPEFVSERSNKANGYATNFMDFYQFMEGENAVAVLSSSATAQTDKLLFIKTTEINEALSEINKLSEEAAQANGDTLYYETYADKEIRELAIEEFPQWLLGKNYAGFQQSFFTTFDDYLLISNNIQNIKNLIVDIETESTWGRSILQNQFIESTLQDANLSVYINTPRAWDMLRKNLSPKWKTFFEENPTQLKAMELLALQFSSEQNKFYTNIEVQYRKSKVTKSLNYFDVAQKVNIGVPIISKPHVVKNHDSGALEVLVQDSTNALHLISANGQILWTEELPGPIQGEVYQIDFYKNQKLQYVFATPFQIHMLDRNGNGVEKYPLEFNRESPIEYFNVVDYDKSKNYRFMVSSREGNVYLFTKEGNLLEGWNPRTLPDRLATIPQHIRVRSKDFMIAMQENGMVNLMNRRGEMKPGFPLNINDRISNNLFFEVGNNFDQTNLVTITQGGEVAKVSFTGKISAKQQLYKPTKETTFKLVPDALQRTYIIGRQDLNRVSILDREGKLLFDKDYLSQEDMKVQYYNFGVSKEIIVITDSVQGFSYIYDTSGNLVNRQPLESEHEVGVLYYESDSKFLIYSCYQNTFRIVSFEY